MMNFKEAKTQAMNGVGRHSTLITFVLATIGVAATAYLASKEIPKAKAEVKEILTKEDLTKTQKATESVKVVAKNTWKTAVVALGTILLVTGTAAITTANTAATVAGLTSALNLAETKLKDATEAINELPQKTQEEVKRNISQKVVNRATNDLTTEDIQNLTEGKINVYPWVNEWDGTVIVTTFDIIDTLEELIDAKITQQGCVTVGEVYELLERLGAKILWKKEQDKYNKMYTKYGWEGGFTVRHSVYLNGNGDTIYSITMSDPDKL